MFSVTGHFLLHLAHRKYRGSVILIAPDCASFQCCQFLLFVYCLLLKLLLMTEGSFFYSFINGTLFVRGPELFNIWSNGCIYVGSILVMASGVVEKTDSICFDFVSELLMCLN